MNAHQLEVLIANCIITFNIVFGADQQSLSVSYVFENRSDRPAAIFNLLHAPDQHPAMVDPSRVSIWPKGDHLEIAKMAYPAPPDTLLETLYIPMASIVEPGGRLIEEVQVPVPFRLWHPYFDRSEATPEDLSHLEGVRFRLGFFLADPGFIETLEITELADRRVALIVPFDPDQQSIAEFTMAIPGLPDMVAAE